MPSTNDAVSDGASFDYIIVGGGSAGCVLANRLSKDESISVLLIEGGGDAKDIRIKVPAGILALYCNPKFDYMYLGAPQPKLNNRQIMINRGRALGGSSSVNSMVYIRGAKEDYDEWQKLGCDGWSYDDVLPIFKDLENNAVGQSADFHGFDGEVCISNHQDPNVVSKKFVEAGSNIGLPVNKDFNAESQYGVGLYNVSQKNGERHSSFVAFLKPVLDRKNLSVVTGTAVHKLLMDGAKVTGVIAKQSGASKTFYAKSEVLLSAGTIESPRILLESGIGPAKELKESGIDCNVDLPGVGKNLRDHMDAYITVKTPDARGLGISFKKLPRVLSAPFEYFGFKKGMLSSNYVEAGGFAKTNPSDELPDIQFHFFPGFRSHRGKVFELGHGICLHTCLLRPKSHGEVTISKKPNGETTTNIDHKFLSEAEDGDTLVKGIKIARSIMNNEAFGNIRGEEMLPGPSVQTDDEILEFIRSTAGTVFHPVGTCSMGVGENAVVDPADLKVKKVENLRVIDASIMPTMIGGNTNMPTMMIAEKISRVILRKRTSV